MLKRLPYFEVEGASILTLLLVLNGKNGTEIDAIEIAEVTKRYLLMIS